MRKTYYPFLDGFRAIAILFVMGRHIREGFDLKTHFFSHNNAVMEWAYFKAWQVFGIDLSPFYLWIQFLARKVKGIIGVEMFLVISGFLITGILLGKDLEAISPRRFYTRRFFKIYPSYLLLVLVGCFLLFSQAPELRPQVPSTAAHYLLFLQNYFPYNPFLAHTWTLVIIEQFYLVAPLVIVGVYALVRSPHGRRAVLMGLCLLIMAVAPVLRTQYQTAGHALWLWPGQPNLFPSPATFLRMDAIAFGCLLALLEPYWLQWRANKWWGMIFWAAGAFSYYNLFFVIKWGYYTGPWWAYTLSYLAFGMFFFAAYHGVSVLSRCKSLQWVGRHSYGIFLWHYLLLPFWGPFLGVMPTSLLILGYVVSCIAAGVLSTVTIERYFLSLRERVAPAQ